jgi:hypothetical protein
VSLLEVEYFLPPNLYVPRYVKENRIHFKKQKKKTTHNNNKENSISLTYE